MSLRPLHTLARNITIHRNEGPQNQLEMVTPWRCLNFLSWWFFFPWAIKRLWTRSAAVRHWRGHSLSAYERDLVTNVRFGSKLHTAADLVRRRFIAPFLVCMHCPFVLTPYLLGLHVSQCVIFCVPRHYTLTHMLVDYYTHTYIYIYIFIHTYTMMYIRTYLIHTQTCTHRVTSFAASVKPLLTPILLDLRSWAPAVMGPSQMRDRPTHPSVRSSRPDRTVETQPPSVWSGLGLCRLDVQKRIDWHFGYLSENPTHWLGFPSSRGSSSPCLFQQDWTIPKTARQEYMAGVEMCSEANQRRGVPRIWGSHKCVLCASQEADFKISSLGFYVDFRDQGCA